MSRSTPCAAALGFLFSVVAALTPLSAGAATWINTYGGDWNEDSNWLPADVPESAGETATIPNDGHTYTIILDLACRADWVRLENPLATIRMSGFSFYLGSNEGLTNYGTVVANTAGARITQPFTNHAGAALLIQGADYLELNGQTIVNDGAIIVNPDGVNSPMVLRFTGTGNIDLGGSGEIELRTSGDPNDAKLITCGGGGTLVQDSTHTIRGGGTVNPRLTNYGLVSVDFPGRSLVFSSEPKTNHATFQAVGGGVLVLGAGPITQGTGGRPSGRSGPRIRGRQPDPRRRPHDSRRRNGLRAPHEPRPCRCGP